MQHDLLQLDSADLERVDFQLLVGDLELSVFVPSHSHYGRVDNLHVEFFFLNPKLNVHVGVVVDNAMDGPEPHDYSVKFSDNDSELRDFRVFFDTKCLFRHTAAQPFWLFANVRAVTIYLTSPLKYRGPGKPNTGHPARGYHNKLWSKRKYHLDILPFGERFTFIGLFKRSTGTFKKFSVCSDTQSFQYGKLFDILVIATVKSGTPDNGLSCDRISGHITKIHRLCDAYLVSGQYLNTYFQSAECWTSDH
ncbi:hypothetical protein BR93DRAFT_964245 [Coniochaeta sp. PMI_546]|nr:hypothetical protein BR93DRAFT_964245 [Coniochaeta sp. PMI_546]